MNIVEEAKAIAIAIKAHTGQFRRDGEAYINHLNRVANKMYTDVDKAAAWMHDVIEDTPVTAEQLLSYGFSTEIVDAIVALSRKKGQTYFDFITAQVVFNPIAVRVKRADLEDNLATGMEGSQKDKYRFAQFFLNSR